MKFTLVLLHSLFLAGNCLIAVSEEILGQSDLIKSCAEPEFKMVWGLFIRRKVQQNVVLFPSVRSAPFPNQNEVSGRGCKHGRIILAEKTPFMGRFHSLTITAGILLV